MLVHRWKSFWLRLPDGARYLARSGAQAILAGLFGIAFAGAALGLDQAFGLTLPAGIQSAESLIAALVAAIITLAVFTLWMRSIVAGLASSQISPRIVASYLDDGFQWRLIAGMAAMITFTATILLGLPVDDQERAPALSVSLSVLVVILGLVMVLMALRQGVHSLAPPRIVHTLAEQARGSMVGHGVPDDLWPEDRSRIPSPSRGRIVSQDMGWVARVDHRRLMHTIPPEAHLGLFVDVGTFVGVGDVMAVCSSELSDDAEHVIRNCLSIQTARSPETDPAFALQQLRDLAQQAMGSHRQDTSTAFDALLYLRAVLGEFIAQHEPTGDALGPEGRAITSAGRRRVYHHVQETLGPLVHLASHDPLSRPDVRTVLDDLVSEARRMCGALDPDEVLRRLDGLRAVLEPSAAADGEASSSLGPLQWRTPGDQDRDPVSDERLREADVSRSEGRRTPAT